jgi:Spy/CpxP family protein refolding chaperone
MKNKLIRVAGLGALATGMICAQSGSQDPAQVAPQTQQQSGRRAAPAQRRAHFGKRLAAYLNLSADQQAQAKQIFASAKQDAAPLRQQMMQHRQALAAAVKAGNDAQIDQITKDAAPVHAQLAAIRAHTMQKIYATLTPEQKAKADHMRRFFGPNAAQHRRQAG